MTFFGILSINSYPQSDHEKKHEINSDSGNFTGYLASISEDHQSHKKQERLNNSQQTREMGRDKNSIQCGTYPKLKEKKTSNKW